MPPAIVLPCAEGEIVMDQTWPAAVSQRLEGESGGRILHLFSHASGFLQFLTSESAGDCIANPAWVPLLLLPLECATHLRDWLEKTHPRDWPWALMEKKHFADSAVGEVAGRFVMQMGQLLGQKVQALGGELERQYLNRATPRQILLEKNWPLRVMAFPLDSMDSC